MSQGLPETPCRGMSCASFLVRVVEGPPEPRPPLPGMGSEGNVWRWALFKRLARHGIKYLFIKITSLVFFFFLDFLIPTPRFPFSTLFEKVLFIIFDLIKISLWGIPIFARCSRGPILAPLKAKTCHPAGIHTSGK